MLDAAGHVFARGGYHSTSMDEIADASQVSKPLLYAYFGSKEGLYVAYIHRTGRQLLDRLARTPRPEGDTVACLRKAIAEFLAFVEEYRDGWIVLFSEMTASKPLADEVAELRNRIADAVREMLDTDLRSHAGPASAGLAHAIVGAGESLANWWLEHPAVPRAEVADWYEAVVQSALAAALRHRPPADR
jgi:AcrR family transcriptional regulator